MFAALQIIDSESAAAKMRRILKRPKVTAYIHELLGIRFAIICAETYTDGQPDWDEVEYVAQDYSRWILLPNEFTDVFPSGSGLRVYNPAQFDRMVLMNTACRIIHRTRMPMYRRVLGMLDEDGRCADMLYPLLNYFTSVRVVTRNLACYSKAADAMMDELGAPVAVGTTLSALSDCVIAIAPDGFESDENIRLPCPVLIARQDSLRLRYQADAASRLTVAFPSGITPPDGIDTHLLAAALHTMCGVQEIEPIAHNMLYCNQYLNFEQFMKLYSLSFLT